MADDAAVTDTVAVIGTGAVGTAVARRLLEDGRDVVVWNRTPQRTEDPVGRGARPARSVAEAVAGSGLALLTLPDPRTALDCLASLSGDLGGRTLAALGTADPDGARRLAVRAAEVGAHFLQVGLQGAAADIGTEAVTLLVSGSPAAVERHGATLGVLGRTRHAGETAEAAAAWDLALLGVWYDAQLGVLRALDAAREAGVDLDAFAATVVTQLGHVVAGVPGTVAELRQDRFPPGPADLGQHLDVVRRLVDLRAGRPLGDGGLTAVGATLADLVAEGRAGEGLTAVAGVGQRSRRGGIRVSTAVPSGPGSTR
ncbi:NAD(P)-binding domain-containing protein [Blastococcus sp. SYSU D00813]